jgi:hypothetical protein
VLWFAAAGADTPGQPASCATPSYDGSTFQITCTVPQATVTQTVTVAPSPTPTPTPTVSGASPTPSATTTAPAPGGFPTAATTGVPAGTALTAVNGNLTTSSSGQVITGKSISGDLMVSNPNVTLVNSRVKGRIIYQSTGLKVTDSDVGPDTCPSSGGDYQLITGSDYTLTRAHFHSNNEDLVRLVGGGGTDTITDSLLDGVCFYPGAHLDSVQLYDPGSTARLVINHSTVDVRPVNASGGGNSAVFWADNPAKASTLTISNSLLAGGNYTLALYDAGTIKVTGNTFVRGSYQYGPCATNIPVTFTGNVYDDGTPLTSC